MSSSLRACSLLAKALPVCLVILAALAPVYGQAALGSIEGVVVDADNAPVAGVTVYPVSGPAGTGTSHGVLTNGDGRFRIEQMVPGTYKLSAFKLEDGYADAADPFYADPEHPLPTVTISPATQNSEFSIQLGARCGTLHVEVTDAVSHSPVTSGVLVLQLRNNPSAVMEGDKSFPGDFLVPPVDVGVEIHKPGYSIWRVSENGRDYVSLRAGGHHTIHADLQPNAAK